MLIPRTPLAWRNLTHKRASLLVSIAAVAFAILIMFMELGFLNGLYDSQTALLRSLRADLVMLSVAQHNLVGHERFRRERLAQAASVTGVSDVAPLWVEDGSSHLRDPESGAEHAIRVIGFDIDQDVLAIPEVEAAQERLRVPRTALFDAHSRGFFGHFPAGTVTELGGQEMTIAGTFRLGADFYYDGTLLMSAESLLRLFPGQSRDRVSLGLIRLAAGADPHRVQDELRERLPMDVEVLTRQQVTAREQRAWRKATPVGYVFGMGVAVGFVIGVIICYQILYTDITDQLPQLATLKAVGFHDRTLIVLVLRQAVLLGVLGFIPGVLGTTVLYSALTAATRIAMNLTAGRVLLILGLTVAMSSVAGMLAVRKALAADPAELF